MRSRFNAPVFHLKKAELLFNDDVALVQGQ